MTHNEDELVFLFGAGISIPLGIPAMEGIYKAFMDKRKSGISEANKRTCVYFTKELGVSQDLEEFLLAANTILEFKNSELINFIESSISRTKNSSKIKEFRKNLLIKSNDAENVKEGILEFLSKTCFKFSREKAVQINTGFVKALAQKGYPVFSTNYDFAFEYVALEEGVNISDNFISKGQRNIWNKSIDFSGDNSFRLIKLHGSVTWYIDNESSIEKIYSSTEYNPLGKEVRNIVIVPTRFKDIYEQHFFALYIYYLNCLSRSKVLIIAGHSLRDDYLRAAIIERKRKGDFTVIVIDPTYPKDIKDELPPARKGSIGDIMHLPFRWEDISDELSHIILNYPVSDTANQLVNVYKRQQYSKNKVKIKGNIRSLKIGSHQEVNVQIDAYLKNNLKPANLRVWMKAEYKDAGGKTVNRVTPNFQERTEVIRGNKLTGVVSEDLEVKFDVPDILNWRKFNATVKLVVGLVSSKAKSPQSVNARTLIASDERILIYRTK